MCKWLAPFICFTAEEAWLARHGNEGGGDGNGESIHLRTFPDIPDDWRDDALAEKWVKIRNLRRVVTGAIELERKEKRIGSSLQAHPVVHANSEDIALFTGLDAAELFITSSAEFSTAALGGGEFSLDDVAGVSVKPDLAQGEKCERCWKVLPEVGSDPDHPGTCSRCADAVRHARNPAA